MGSGRECGAMCGRSDGDGGSVGLCVGEVMGIVRECGALCGSGDGEWEGVWDYVC